MAATKEELHRSTKPNGASRSNTSVLRVAAPDARAGSAYSPPGAAGRSGLAIGNILLCYYRLDKLMQLKYECGVGNESPFFIVGSGRSGSTLLRLILAKHSRIEIPPETWFLLRLVRELPLSEPLTPAEVETAVQIITAEYRWPDFGLDKDEFAGEARALRQPRLADIADLVYTAFRRRSGKPRTGDKTPPYVTIIPELAAIYPDARFIHLVRDGRDVVTSYLDADFPGVFWDAEFAWTRAIRRVRAAQAGPLAERILEVRYEELVSNPESTVRGICDFLGEAFEPGMLRYQESVAEKVPARERAIHAALAEPISARAVLRWRARLTPLEQFAIESCMRRELEQAGYSLRFAGPLWRPVLRVAGVAIQAVGPFIGRVARAFHDRGWMQRAVYIWRGKDRRVVP
ncbi:MAG TPA: sulfotransferase [Acetobacteraceae bacterium]|nr:sulfotransferase [Acetobacteraceae bacterium]